MDLQLTGRRALVTGSSRGIGRAIARGLALEGARVAVHGRTEQTATAAADALRAEGLDVVPVAGDLASDRGAGTVVQQARNALEAVDILVNNAGTFEVCDWNAGDATRWADVYNVNVLSTVRMIHAVLPDMKVGGWGRIIQIASVSATLGPPPFPDYAAAKAATLNLTVSLSKALAGTGITVNTVSPGPVETETWRAFARGLAAGRDWGEDIEDIKAGLLAGVLENPVGRIGRPEDVAGMVSYLASPRADYVNAVNIRVDGGLVSTVA